jgi:ABC-type multidrug transport system fused ATPase/permease subunit
MMSTCTLQAWCNTLGVLVVSVVGLYTVYQADSFSDKPGIVGMYLSYAVLFGLFLAFTSMITMQLLQNMTSLERLFEYKQTGFSQEAPWALPEDPHVTSWPKTGSITFKQVSLRYRHDLPLALTGLDLTIAGAEKIGVVGRTGAGKSSITSVLFGLVPLEAGEVLIDGVSINLLGVHTLRKALSMIPQEPIVMSGSVRYNLDPFSKHTDAELSRVLKVVGLQSYVTLDTPAGGSDAALSTGQRQLLTFSRTLLQKSQIVVMDEPTASVDMQTDRLVQSAARQHFADRTVILIAHRLDTVRECNRIAVMDAGRLMEIGPPADLLKDPSSLLSKLHGTTEAPSSPAAGTLVSI